MNRALIIEQRTATNHCAQCDDLVARLRRMRWFEEIVQSDFNRVLSSLPVVPDLVVVRAAKPADATRAFECGKSAWPETRIFLVLCQDLAAAYEANLLPPAGFDELILCCASELDWKLRVQRILLKLSDAAPFTMLGNITHNGIQVNGACLAAPWAPLNVLAP